VLFSNNQLTGRAMVLWGCLGVVLMAALWMAE